MAAPVLRGRGGDVGGGGGVGGLLPGGVLSTVGVGGGPQLIREGGARVIWFLGIAALGAVLQNLLGIALAWGLGVDPRLGILTGAVALAGGPATSLAFGGTFEKMGVQGATTVAFAAATFGITVAGLTGGYIGGRPVPRPRRNTGAGAGGRRAAASGGTGSQ